MALPALSALLGVVSSGVVAALRLFLPALGSYLLSLALKLMLGLGVSLVSYKLLGVAVQGVLDRVADSYFQIPPDIVALFGLAGIPDALNIIFGGFSFSFGIWASYRTLKFLNK